MSQQLPSEKLESTWGKFATQQAATQTQNKLKEAGIDLANITLETEDFNPPIKLEDTQTIASLKAGAIAGGVLGALVGLFVSLVFTDFANLGIAALKNFQTIHYFAPIMGAIVGAAGMSLIAGNSGASVLKDNTDNNPTESKRYLVVVKATAEKTSLAREIITQQGGLVEEADRR